MCRCWPRRGPCAKLRRRAYPGLVMTEHALFEQLSLQGTTIVAATGDTGAYACASTSSAGAPSVNLPASDPYVLAVAATELVSGAAGGGDGAPTAMSGPGPATALRPAATIAVRRGAARAAAPVRCSTPAMSTETISPGKAPCPTESPTSSGGCPTSVSRAAAPTRSTNTRSTCSGSGRLAAAPAPRRPCGRRSSC